MSYVGAYLGRYLGAYLGEGEIAESTAYTGLLIKLLPPGRVWRLFQGSDLYKLLTACAAELGRLAGRVSDLLNEADPSTANELISDYERELGITAVGTLQQRRAVVVSRLVARQRYRPIDFETILAPLLGLDPVDVEVLERTHAIAESMGDDREIFRFFVYRDPSLPGSYFVDSAQELVDIIKPSHTDGQVIESVDFLCDDEFSLCDRDLLGA